jgi:hypothetical protein
LVPECSIISGAADTVVVKDMRKRNKVAYFNAFASERARLDYKTFKKLSNPDEIATSIHVWFGKTNLERWLCAKFRFKLKNFYP